MSDITLDCKGLPCPQPVLKCKNCIEEDNPERIIVTVDNDAAKENVSRFLTTQGYSTSVTESDSVYTIIGARSGDECEVCEIMTDAQLATVDNHKILAFISADVVGSGDDTLGGNLMFNFLSTLKELGPELWRIILVNGGVKLAVPENRCMEELKKLEESGVSILVCGTCLEHFNLTGKQEVGEVTNMLDVVTSFQLASKTIQV